MIKWTIPANRELQQESEGDEAGGRDENMVMSTRYKDKTKVESKVEGDDRGRTCHQNVKRRG